MNRRAIFIGFLGVAMSLSVSQRGAGEDIRFPSDPGVIDVTQAPNNADKTGKEDASDAIRGPIKAGLGSRSCLTGRPQDVEPDDALQLPRSSTGLGGPSYARYSSSAPAPLFPP